MKWAARVYVLSVPTNVSANVGENVGESVGVLCFPDDQFPISAANSQRQPPSTTWAPRDSMVTWWARPGPLPHVDTFLGPRPVGKFRFLRRADSGFLMRIW